MVDQYLNKKYKLKSADKLDDYLKVLDIGLLLRKTATSMSHTVELKKNGDGSYTISVVSTIKSTDITFRLGEEFEETRLDGIKVKSTIVLEGNKLVHTQVEDNGRKSVHVREYTEDSLTITTTCDGWEGTCVRTYEKV